MLRLDRGLEIKRNLEPQETLQDRQPSVFRDRLQSSHKGRRNLTDELGTDQPPHTNIQWTSCQTMKYRDTCFKHHQGEGIKKWREGRWVMSDSLWPHTLCSPWNSPGQNTRVGSLSLLQEISPTQGLNPGLPHHRWNLYQLSHKGSPRILEWVAFPFSRGSSQPKDQTQVSHIAGRFFTSEPPGKPRWPTGTLKDALTTIIQHSFGSPSYSNQRRKRNKRNPDGKRSKALTVCRWHDTLNRKPYLKIVSENY